MQIICYNSHYTVHAHDIVYIVYSCMCFIVMVSILCCLHTAKLRLWTRGKFMQTEAVNCRLRVKCRQHGAKYRMRTADLG